MGFLEKYKNDLYADGLFAESNEKKRDEFFSQYSYSDRIILFYLKKTGECSMGDLAKNTCISNSTLNYMVKQLIKKELVTSRKDEKDKRIILVKLTGDGKKQYQKIDSFVKKNFKKVEEALVNDLKAVADEKEVDKVMEILSKLR